MPLEIIGPGFGRTGTNSLKLALEHLGFGPCHHMFEVRDHPDLLSDWERAVDRKPVDWNRVFDGYRAQVDWPGAKFWRELAATFPNARVVLTVRDPDAWFDSVQATIAPFIAARGKHTSPHTNAIAAMAHHLLAQVFGEEGWTNRVHATRVFREHIADVQSTIPAGRLLTFDLSDGWRPLCAFLGVPVPDMPFPQTNSSKEFVDKEWKQPPAPAPA
jgi:hypothetical protein